MLRTIFFIPDALTLNNQVLPIVIGAPVLTKKNCVRKIEKGLRGGSPFF